MIIGGLVAASSALVRAIDTTVPTLSASPDVGGPGFEFTLTVDDCVEGDSVSFEVYFQFETVGCDGGVATSSEFQATFPPGEQTVFATVSDGPLLLQDPIEPCDESGDRPCTVTTTIDVLPASLTADPDEGEPGFGFTMTLENCGIDPIVFDSIDLAIESDPGQVVEFVVPETGEEQEAICLLADGQVTSDQFEAPDEVGEYLVYAFFPNVRVGQEPGEGDLPPECDETTDNFNCAAYATITVTEPVETTTTTTTTTTEAPTTTTEAPTTTVAPPTTVDDADAEPPVLTLPATGPGDTGGIAGVAALALLFGGGLLVIAGTRRRSI